MASQQDTIDACLKLASSSAKIALEKSIDDAITALEIAESLSEKMAERDTINEACRGLFQFKKTWAEGYAEHLLAEFHAPHQKPLSTASTDQTPDSHQARASSLTLVDDSEVTQAIESARLLQHMQPQLDQSLPELDKLVSAAVGLKRVQPHLNPMRPEVFAKCLLDLLYGVAASPAVTALWIKHLGVPLGRELSRVYERLVNFLELSQVRGVNYGVLATPDASKGRAKMTEGASSPSTPVVQTIGDQDWQHQGMLQSAQAPAAGQSFEQFLTQSSQGAPGSAQARQPTTPAFRAQMQREWVAMTAELETQTSAHMLLSDAQVPSAYAPIRPDGQPSAYQSMPAVDRPQRAINQTSTLNNRVWGRYAAPRQRAMVHSQLKAEAQQVSQVMGLEAVKQLVNEVAKDHRLLAPVRESIVALEPALLRLSMVDPHFFGDEKHPGRQLMERVAQRSFQFNDEFSPEFESFFKPLTQAFNALNGLGEVSAAQFDTALGALQKRWSAQDQAEATRKRDMLERMQFAEERQTQADEIAYELSNRVDLDDVPGLVLDFLFGPWSLAMAHARLCDTRHQLDPEGLGAAVPDLLWSAKPRATIKQPAKLIEMIPSLLGKLQSGLQLLGTDPRETAPFFDGLLKLHQPVLKLRRLKSQRDAQQSSHSQLSETESLMAELNDAAESCEPATADQRRAKVAALPWMGRQDMAEAGFEDTQPTDYADLQPDPPRESVSAGDSPAGNAADLTDETITSTTNAGEDKTESGSDAASTQGVNPLAAAQATLQALRAGDWVDLYSRQRWLRAQLTWASTKGTLFMFVSHGGQPHSMTKRSCERLIATRLLRPVNTRGVVDRALKVVVADAANPPLLVQRA